MAAVFLKIFNSRRFTEVKKLESLPAVIGSALSSSIVVELDDDQAFSLKIDSVPSGFAIEKTAGRGRILLNGKQVHTATIRPGDVLTIDTYDIGFYTNNPSPAVVPPLFGRIAKTEVETVINQPVLNITDKLNEDKIQEASKKKQQMQDELQKISSTKRKAPAKKKSKVEVPPAAPSEETVVEKTAVTQIDEVLKSQSVPEPPAEKKTKKEAVERKIPSAPAAPSSPKKLEKESSLPKKEIPQQPASASAFEPLPKKNIRRAMIEVLVVWGDRVLETHHFEGAQEVVIGGHEDCDIQLPVFAHRDIQHKILQIGVRTRVFLNQRIKGDLFENGRRHTFEELLVNRRLIREGAAHALVLDRDEVVSISLPGTPLTLIVKYVPAAPKPFLAPLFDLTASEMTGLIMSVMLAVMLSMYVTLNAPKEKPKDVLEMSEPIRYAQLIYKPKPVPVKRPEPPKVKPPEPPKVIEKVNLKKKIVKKKPKPKPKKPRRKKKKVTAKAPKKVVPRVQTGESKRIRPKKMPKAPVKVTSVRKGKSKKVSKKGGASASTKKKDISQVGVLGILANNGYRKKIDEAASGVGVLTGIADTSTGEVGETENLEGELRGKALKDDGRGGQGLSTVGIENIGTKGLGTGDQNYGQTKLGDRARPQIKFGGDEEEFVGKIDREAIRRVIRNNANQLRNCYETELRKDDTLGGMVEVEWKLGVKGQALSPRVISSTLESETEPSAANPRAVEACIIRRLKGWRFPEPPPGVIGLIKYPFRFVSQR